LEQLAEQVAEDIRKYGAENVSTFRSDATPEELSRELETYKGKTYDVEREAEALERGIDVSDLVGGSTGSADLDRELLELQQGLGITPKPEDPIPAETQEEVDPEDALEALMAEMGM
jgi:hypothetical protein